MKKILIGAIFTIAWIILTIQGQVIANSSLNYVDLNNWTNHGDGNWNVETGGRTVTQTINGQPTFFLSPEDYIDVIITGTIEVDTASDDDFIGFVMGYENTNSYYDFVLFDWKQTTQSNTIEYPGKEAKEGFTLGHFAGELNSTTYSGGLGAWSKYFWFHEEDEQYNLLDTNNNPGTGWEDFTEYVFKILYTQQSIKIVIDDQVIFDVSGTFQPGKIGFYNNSQNPVIYGNVQIASVTSGSKNPVAQPDEYGMTMNSTLSIDRYEGLLFNDYDPNLDSYKIENITEVSNGVLAVNPDTGAFTYTPTEGFTGMDSFTYNLVENTVEALKSETVEVKINVISGVNTAPTDINLSNLIIDSSINTGDLVGTLTSIDANVGDFHDYILINSSSGRFHINNNQILVNDKSSINPGETYTIEVQSTDFGGLSINKTFDIIVRSVLTFDANSGVGTMSSQNIVKGTTTQLAINTFTKTGYAFAGWNTEINGDGEAYIDEYNFTMSLGSETLYAQWAPITYNITYNLEGGTIDNNPTSYTIETPTITLKNPTKVGYTFEGWYDNLFYIGSPITEISLGSTGNISLYAKYSISRYTLEYLDYDGTVLQTAEYVYNSNLSGVTPPTQPTRTGYTFDGWSGTVPTTMGTSDVTITATYTINKYTVEYVDHDGTVLQTAEYEYDSDLSGVTAPSNPSRTGYTFNGWSGTVPTTMGTSDVTITATYTINKYTVEYVDHDGTLLQTGEYDYNSDLSGVTAPSNPTRIGYTFNGWSGTVPVTMGANDVTITATYTINKYTVEYVDYDGTVLKTGEYDYNSNLSGVTAPSNPTRTGYTFDGWDSSLSSNMPANDITITATYTINKYTVEYVDYDGTVLQTSEYDFGSDLSIITAPSNPSRTGYTFNGWSGTVPTTMGTSDVTITANYSINKYTVEYLDHDGTVLQTSEYDFGSDLSIITAPINPSRTGYTFNGWSGTVPVTMGTSDVTITANYSINKYTVEYVDHDGTVLQTGEYDYNSNLSGVTAPTQPTRTGYTFNGWSGTVPVTMGANDVTITATYTINKYTVEYLDYDGTILKTGEYDYNSNLSGVTAPTQPTRTGYTFDGWDSSLSSNMPANDITITATYTINKYTVEYLDYDGTILKTGEYDYNSNLSGVTAPSNPTRTGYTFDGWDSSLSSNMPANDITITATYTINKYTVEYVDYDGTVLQTSEYDFGSDLSIITAPSNPSRTGYTFNGWGGTVPTTMGTSDITITATYTINKYTVEYVDHDGTVLQTAEYDYNSDLSGVTAPTQPTRTGYTFDGWSGTVPTTMGSSDVTITATYTINKYTVEYVDHDGTVLQTAEYVYNSDLSGVTAPTQPTRIGYTFNGWNNILPNIMPNEKLTIRATYFVLTTNDDDTIVEGLDSIIAKVKEEIGESKDVKVTVNVRVHMEEDEDENEVSLINELIKENMRRNTKFFNLDISIIAEVDDDSFMITDLTDPMTITITIPEEYRGYDEYQIIRVHNGVATILNTKYDSQNHKLTFETNQFSTYSVTYSNNFNFAWILVLVLFLAIVGGLYYFKSFFFKHKEKTKLY